MKTTIDISDAILLEAKRVAAEEKTTLRALVEAGLVAELSKRERRGDTFELRDASFQEGRGLRAEFEDGEWSRIIEAAYEGRGG